MLVSGAGDGNGGSGGNGNGDGDGGGGEGSEGARCSRAAHLGPLGLPFGLVHGQAVPTGLAHGADALHAAHQLQQQRDHLGTGERTHTQSQIFMEVNISINFITYAVHKYQINKIPNKSKYSFIQKDRILFSQRSPRNVIFRNGQVKANVKRAGRIPFHGCMRLAEVTASAEGRCRILEPHPDQGLSSVWYNQTTTKLFICDTRKQAHSHGKQLHQNNWQLFLL